MAKMLYAGLILIAVRVIMLTESRTAFVGVLTFGFILWAGSRKKIVSLGLIMAVFVVIWQMTPETTRERFLTLKEAPYVMETKRSQFSHEQVVELGSMNSRWQLIRHSLIAFYENPVLGLGLDCFASFNGRRWGVWDPPHNTYLQVLCEVGMLGFIFFSLVIILTCRNLREGKKRLQRLGLEKSYLSTLISGLTTYYYVWLVVSFFGIELYNNFWWIAGGLSVVMLRIIRNEKEKGIKI